METLLSLTTAITKGVDDPSVTDADILAVLNRGVLEIAGGGTRNYSVPTLPALPELSEDFEVTTDATSSVAMPAEYQRDAWYGFASNGDPLAFEKSLLMFRRKYGISESGNVSAICVTGRTMHYSGSPDTPAIITVHGFRFPVDMVINSDSPDGIPAHLQYRLLYNYACMELYGIVEQDAKAPGYNFSKHSNAYESALKDLHDAILKDQPDEYVEVDFDSY